jgi:hypothetical protein
MDKIVPLAASTVKGPLGVAHLPRLWLTAALASAGLLPDGYPEVAGETDRAVLAGIGLDVEETFAYLASLPSYQAFEVWVRAHARGLDPAAVNAAVGRGRAGSEALADWARVHAALGARDGAGGDPIVPAVSSQSSGPLGLVHLPRFWMKATLSAAGALYPSWVSGQASGFDRAFAAEAGFDLDAAIAHVHAERPTYPQFEAWFAALAGPFDDARLPKHNAALLGRQKPEEIAARERAVLGIDDPTYRPSVTINDLMDWRELHAICVTAARGERSPA